MVIDMEKRLKKLLGDDIEILRKDELMHLAVISRSQDGITAYVLFKLFSIEKPLYNYDGFQPTEKQWKKFFPIVVKAGAESEFILTLYDLLTVDTSKTFIAAEEQL